MCRGGCCAGVVAVQGWLLCRGGCCAGVVAVQGRGGCCAGVVAVQGWLHQEYCFITIVSTGL